LFNRGKIRSIKDLYALGKSDFEDIEGFAEKKIKNFIDELQRSKKVGSADFLGRLGIPLVQGKTMRNLGITSVDEFLSFNDDKYVAGRNIIEWKDDPANILMLNELREILDITEKSEVLSRGRVAMTGKGPMARKELISAIAAAGYEFAETVTSDTAILLCEDPSSGSSKLKKAEKLGVKVVSYEEFFSS
jgi:DNA ligase (NAD+)